MRRTAKYPYSTRYRCRVCDGECSSEARENAMLVIRDCRRQEPDDVIERCPHPLCQARESLDEIEDDQ